MKIYLALAAGLFFSNHTSAVTTVGDASDATTQPSVIADEPNPADDVTDSDISNRDRDFDVDFAGAGKVPFWFQYDKKYNAVGFDVYSQRVVGSGYSGSGLIIDEKAFQEMVAKNKLSHKPLQDLGYKMSEKGLITFNGKPIVQFPKGDVERSGSSAFMLTSDNHTDRALILTIKAFLNNLDNSKPSNIASVQINYADGTSKMIAKKNPSTQPSSETDVKDNLNSQK